MCRWPEEGPIQAPSLYTFFKKAGLGSFTCAAKHRQVFLNSLNDFFLTMVIQA